MGKPKVTTKTAKEIEKEPELSKIDNKTPEIVKKENPLYDGFNFRPVGRPTKYRVALIEKVYDFIELRTSQNNIPTVEGLGLYLRVNKSTLYEWEKKHKRFSNALDNLLKVQGEMLQMNGLNGWYNPTITQLLLKNNHKFKDKHEIDHTSEGERIGSINYITPDDPADSNK